MFRDVIVRREGNDEWIVISREAAVTGERLLLDLPDAEDCSPDRRFPACVIESRPVIVDGDVRSRIRLHDGQPANALSDERIARG